LNPLFKSIYRKQGERGAGEPRPGKGGGCSNRGGEMGRVRGAEGQGGRESFERKKVSGDPRDLDGEDKTTICLGKKSKKKTNTNRTQKNTKKKPNEFVIP